MGKYHINGNKMKLSIKTGVLSVLMAMAAGSASAEEILKMAFLTEDGATTTMAAASLSMKVSGQTLIAANDTQNLEFELSKLVKMYFTTGTDGVELLPVEISSGAVSAYTLDGTSAGTYDSAAAAMTELPSGIYILRTRDNNTLKIVVQ